MVMVRRLVMTLTAPVCAFVDLPRAPRNLRLFPDLSTWSVTLEWDSFKVAPDDIVVEMRAEDESEFSRVATLKGKITQLLIEHVDKTKRYSFRVTGRNESGSGEVATVELAEPLYKEPPATVEQVATKEEVQVRTEVITEEVTEVTEVTETGQSFSTAYIQHTYIHTNLYSAKNRQNESEALVSGNCVTGFIRRVLSNRLYD